jgi:hypothetical protein
MPILDFLIGLGSEEQSFPRFFDDFVNMIIPLQVNGDIETKKLYTFNDFDRVVIN